MAVYLAHPDTVVAIAILRNDATSLFLIKQHKDSDSITRESRRIIHVFSPFKGPDADCYFLVVKVIHQMILEQQTRFLLVQHIVVVIGSKSSPENEPKRLATIDGHVEMNSLCFTRLFSHLHGNVHGGFLHLKSVNQGEILSVHNVVIRKFEVGLDEGHQRLEGFVEVVIELRVLEMHNEIVDFIFNNSYLIFHKQSLFIVLEDLDLNLSIHFSKMSVKNVLRAMHTKMDRAITLLLQEVKQEPAFCFIDFEGLNLFFGDTDLSLEVVCLPDGDFRIEGFEGLHVAKSAAKLINHWFETQQKRPLSDDESPKVPKTPKLDLE